MNEIYSSKNQLICCEFPNLQRAIGVEVNQYSSHLSIDCERVSISVDSVSFGRTISLDEVQEQVTKSTAYIVAHLDKVIAELQSHRTRLAEELESIRANGINLVEAEKA